MSGDWIKSVRFTEFIGWSKNIGKERSGWTTRGRHVTARRSMSFFNDLKLIEM